jgi:lipopolysaccharide/colanic/teichoic acid biosynthesis glycosyltransferase
VVALAIRLDSRGPVLFRQERVGRDGQPFTMLKFRTMVEDAEERLPDVSHLNEAEGHFFKIADDPRVTGIGGTLRRWSIDELPQLLNVLRGQMSMVGPRPPLPHEVAAYDAWHLRRLRVRPGVTGVWQVSGRSDVPFDEAVRLDLFYIENWSLGYDLYLLGRTFGAVLSRRGAR